MPFLLGVQFDQLRPIDRIGAAAVPLLLASGTADRHTTIDEARDLFAHAHAPKQFWAVEGAAHVDLERYAGMAYWGHVLPFLEEHLRPKPVL